MPILDEIALLTQENAQEIADQWHYDGIYAFYDMANDPEDYTEIITPRLRANRYFQIMGARGLAAFFCIVPINQSEAEIGLGIRPDLTGQGNGAALIKKIEDFVIKHYPYQTLHLSVAAFNARALKVYLKAGYAEIGRSFNRSNGSVYEFIRLRKNIIQP